MFIFKTYYPFTEFYTHLFYYFFSMWEVSGTPPNLATIVILSFGHMIVLGDIDDIIRYFDHLTFGLSNYIMTG